VKDQTANAGFPAGTEAALWRGVGARWKQLFGDFNRLGVSFEWNELPGRADVDWAQSFHPGSVELCLNLSGLGEVREGNRCCQLGAWSAAFYREGPRISALRRTGDDHLFVTVEFSPAFLQRHLDACSSDLHPLVRGMWMPDQAPAEGLSEVEPLNSRQRDLVLSLRQPPVLAAAQSTWFQAKAIELMGEFFFQQPPAAELFCHRHQRVARTRVELVEELIKRNLANPPTLQQIAKDVGCSPFYLSRMFSKEKGQTIPQFVRQLRLERAAALLRSGKHNVTEAALEVGYNSLSHFSHAFHQQFGCCPGLYPVSVKALRGDP
jgi:AraC-like DNA-binding protein